MIITAKEAMRIRENATAEDVDNKELHKCIDEALEKQIPKKPNVYGDGYDDLGNMIYDTYDCPNCDTSFELDYEEHDYEECLDKPCFTFYRCYEFLDYQNT